MNRFEIVQYQATVASDASAEATQIWEPPVLEGQALVIAAMGAQQFHIERGPNDHVPEIYAQPVQVSNADWTTLPPQPETSVQYPY